MFICVCVYIIYIYIYIGDWKAMQGLKLGAQHGYTTKSIWKQPAMPEMANIEL